MIKYGFIKSQKTGEPNSTLALFFNGKQRPVSRGKKTGYIRCIVRESSDAVAGLKLHFKAIFPQVDRAFYSRLKIRSFFRSLELIEFRQDDDELVSCICYGVGRLLYDLMNGSGHFLNGTAAVQVTVSVHHFLEVVEVYVQHRSGAAGAGRVLEGAGQPLHRDDIPGKVDGSLKWAVDVKLPGMVHARNVKPPLACAKLTGIDESSVKNLPGFIKVISKGNYVAVVCANDRIAREAERILHANGYRGGPGGGSQSSDPFPPRPSPG